MSMPELSEASAAISEPAAVQTEVPTDRRVADFMLGLRKIIFEEIQFASNEILERTQTEMHLLSELRSKMAGAHSVSNISKVYEECGKHQIEFLRRDWERIFKHGERMIEATSSLFKSHSLNRPEFGQLKLIEPKADAPVLP